MNKCKICQSNKFYIKERGPHIGLYCQVCGQWQKWISKQEVNKYRDMGVQDELEFHYNMDDITY